MVTFHPSFWKREAMGHSHTFPNPRLGLLEPPSTSQEEREAGGHSLLASFLLEEGWEFPCLFPPRRRMGVAMTTPSPLSCESKLRVPTMAPSLVKIRRAEATILHFSRRQGERSLSPSTIPSGKGKPWAIATPFPLLAACPDLWWVGM